MKLFLSLFVVATAVRTVGSSETTGGVAGGTNTKKGTTEFDQDPLLGPYTQKDPHPHIQQRNQQLRRHDKTRKPGLTNTQHYSLVESFDQDPLISPYLEAQQNQQQQQPPRQKQQKQQNDLPLRGYPPNEFLKLQDPYSQVNPPDHRRLLEVQQEEDLTIHEKSQWRQEQPDTLPDVDPYLQRRRLEPDRDQRELKIPVGIPVYNPRLCSTKYAGRPILLPRLEPEPDEVETEGTAVEPAEDGGNGGGGRHRRCRRRRCRHRNLRGQGRDLEVPPGVIISTTTTCYFCDGGGDDDDDDDDDQDVPDRGEDVEPPTTGDGATGPSIPGLPDDGPPPPTSGETEQDTGTPVGPIGVVSIPTTKSCEAEHQMLGCGYNAPAGAVPASWLPYVGLTMAYTGQLRLQCVCSPKDMAANSVVATTRLDENLAGEAAQPELISAPIVEQEYAFECLVFPLEPLMPEATVPDRDGGGVGTVTAANIVPEGCAHVDNGICPDGPIPLSPGSTLPGSSNVQCGDTAAEIDHNSGCTYTCQDGRMIQCMCAGDKTGNGRPETWYCRNFGMLSN